MGLSEKEMKLLGEIGDGVKEIKEFKEKAEVQFSGQEAKFTDMEKIIKEGGEKLYRDIDGRLVRLEEYLKGRKNGLTTQPIPGLEDEISKWSITRMVHGMVTGNWDKSGFEKEVMVEQRKKAIDIGTGGAGGGFVIPQEFLAAQFIPELKARAVVIGLGATILAGLTGSPIRIPKKTGSGTAFWIGENPAGGITKSQVTLGELQLNPKTLAMRTQLSNLASLLGNPDIDGMIRTDFVEQAGLAIDLAALRGDGTGGSPTGIANTTAIGTHAIGTNGGLWDWTQATDQIGVVEDANALFGRLGFALHGKVKRKLKKVRIPQFSGQTDGMYVVPPIISDAMAADMLGHPFAVSNQIPTNLTKGSGTSLSEVYFGNWESLIVAMWAGLEILATNVGGDAWAQNAVEIRLIQNVDIGIRHTAAFAYVNDAETV